MLLFSILVRRRSGELGEVQGFTLRADAVSRAGLPFAVNSAHVLATPGADLLHGGGRLGDRSRVNENISGGGYIAVSGMKSRQVYCLIIPHNQAPEAQEVTVLA